MKMLKTFLMEQHIFQIDIDIGDATENVSQFIMPMKSVYNKKYVLKKKNVF
jgi:hypothetical protein